ncbi:MAG TPA: polysaccharide deacetylase family protein [Thermomicrobiaceae bacterium]|nr:polysaccharide deacetylase family protein [Thermomicrobiaceae bacterium]
MPLERPTWPNGARCAVMLTFDNFGESFDLLRYGHAGGANADGVYAPRRGVERVLDLLDRHSVPATFFVEGWNARRYAALAKEIIDRGHEVGVHGWMHEQWSQLSHEREAELVARATDAVAEATGRRPLGWRAPAGLTTTRTLQTLHEAGYGYDSSFGDDDLPYLMRIGADRTEELTELPWSWPLDDAVFYAHPGTIRRPEEVIDLWIDEFDAAWEMTGYFMLICHPRYSGRPARVRALERLIEHIEAHEGVWFARCADVAEAARAWGGVPHHPAPAQMTEAEG